MTEPTKDLRSFEKKIIVLIGHMGSGKSIIWKKLAKILNWNHFDSDKELEKKENKTIAQIFEIYNERYFRRNEELIVDNLTSKKNSVISLGGGAILSKRIRSQIKKKCISIFLKVDIEILTKRLKKNRRRPLLFNTNIKDKIVSLNSERLKYYNQADIIIDNSESLNKILKNIIKILK